MTTTELLNQSRIAETRPQPDDPNSRAALLSTDEQGQLRSRWQQIQQGFVDEPQTAVRQADELVATTIKRVAEIFSAERTRLEGEWSRGDDVTTEDLRQALRRYRWFFDRMLNV